MTNYPERQDDLRVLITAPIDEVMQLRAENERLRALLSEARQYVSDAGPDDDSEVQRNSNALLEQIDTILLSAPF